jgi:uncharacterized protein (PEP-CTERM system associated)
MVLCSAADAADSSFLVTPRVTATELYSSNRNLTAGSASDGWVSNVAPGVHVESSGARLKGYLDYQLNTYYYLGDSDVRDAQHQLGSFFTLEALEKWLFLDANAAIFQRQRSLFDPVSVSSTGTGTANQGEARFLQLSPYIKGRAFSTADYMLRYSLSESQADLPSVANTRVDQVLGALSNQATTGAIGWFADVNATRVDNDLIGQREDVRGRVGLVLPISSQLHVTASGGRERTNYASDDYATTSTPGVGLRWVPTTRTELVGLREKRFFGHGYSWQLSHRTRLVAFRYSDVKDVSALPTIPGGVFSGSLYQLMSDLAAATEPDRVTRAAAVRSRMDQIGPGGSLAESGGATTSRLFIDRTRQATMAIIGVRNIVTFIARRRDQVALSVVAPTVLDDFSLAPAIRERSGTASWVYRLTPISSLTVSTSRLRRDDYGVADLKVDQATGSAAFSYRLTPKATTSVAAYRSRTDSSLRGLIRENAIAVSLMQSF